MPTAGFGSAGGPLGRWVAGLAAVKKPRGGPKSLRRRSMALTADEFAAGLRNLSADLRFVLSDRGVGKRTAGVIGATGLTTLITLAGDDRKDARALFKEAPLSIGPDAEGHGSADKVRARIIMAKLIDAWETSKIRAAERAKAEAEQRASRLLLTPRAGELVVLRRGYEEQQCRGPRGTRPTR